MCCYIFGELLSALVFHTRYPRVAYVIKRLKGLLEGDARFIG